MERFSIGFVKVFNIISKKFSQDFERVQIMKLELYFLILRKWLKSVLTDEDSRII